MIIRITRSGGFAGVQESLGTIDTSTLPEADARRIDHTIDELDELARRTEPVGADLYRYDVDIRDNYGRERTITLLQEDGTAGVVHPALRVLLNAV